MIPGGLVVSLVFAGTNLQFVWELVEEGSFPDELENDRPSPVNRTCNTEGEAGWRGPPSLTSSGGAGKQGGEGGAAAKGGWGGGASVKEDGKFCRLAAAASWCAMARSHDHGEYAFGGNEDSDYGYSNGYPNNEDSYAMYGGDRSAGRSPDDAEMKQLSPKRGHHASSSARSRLDEDRLQALMAGARAAMEAKEARLAEGARFADEERRRAFERLHAAENHLELERTRANDLAYQLEQRNRSMQNFERGYKALIDELSVAKERVQVLQPDALKWQAHERSAGAREREIQHLRNKLAEAEARLRKAEPGYLRFQVLERELDNTKKLLSKARATAMSQSELQSMQDAMLRWEVKDVTNSKKIAELESIIASLNDNNRELTKGAMVGEMRSSQLSDAKRELQLSQKDLEDIAEHAASLESEVETMRNSMAYMEGTLRDRTNHINTLQEHLDEVTDERNRLKDTIKSSSAERRAAEAERRLELLTKATAAWGVPPLEHSSSTSFKNVSPPRRPS
ncbi:hypothetical protein DIPPA_21421 [Diplonema papillatum]|nr:hypothetical protein DIPPA_21421 [Diplonema papillatum]